MGKGAMWVGPGSDALLPSSPAFGWVGLGRRRPEGGGEPRAGMQPPDPTPSHFINPLPLTLSSSLSWLEQGWLAGYSAAKHPSLALGS